MTRDKFFDYSAFTVPPVPDEPIVFAAIGLAHGHIYGMCHGLLRAGAVLGFVFDRDPALVERFLKEFPTAQAAASEEDILQDPAVRLIASADIPARRAPLGVRVMRAGKDFLSDKAPCTTLSQLEDIKATCAETGQKFITYFGESMDSESMTFIYDRLSRGMLGRVNSVIISAPHVLNAPSRPAWFFRREDTGGVLIDIGSHQVHQFLKLTGNTTASVTAARVANLRYPQYAEFDEVGDILLTGENGATGFLHISWDFPKGLGTWGDPRLIIEAEKGYIELRKNVNIGVDKTGEHVFLVTEDGTFHESVQGKIGSSFFHRVLWDVVHRTDTALPLAETLTTMELCIKAQNRALELCV
ncbi:MAG: Gfo/Idh/MocA family oxidoreductase [Ruminococcaceae bacterium]|nr:Gfo/Idh/MocA family oxidoreductase [Oscillospiraceae bacterium]